MDSSSYGGDGSGNSGMVSSYGVGCTGYGGVGSLGTYQWEGAGEKYYAEIPGPSNLPGGLDEGSGEAKMTEKVTEVYLAQKDESTGMSDISIDEDEQGRITATREGKSKRKKMLRKATAKCEKVKLSRRFSSSWDEEEEGGSEVLKKRCKEPKKKVKKITCIICEHRITESTMAKHFNLMHKDMIPASLLIIGKKGRKIK